MDLFARNFALFEEVEVEFEPGFNVLTGETGAGKSLLVGAITFVLGSRVGLEIIRRGTKGAIAEATFDVRDAPLAMKAASELGFEPEDGLLVFSREISTSGRSRFRINGRTVPLSAVRSIAQFLIDVHGQHEHQSLLDGSRHVDFLDSLGGEEVARLRERVERLYREWRSLCEERERIIATERERAQRLDLLQFQKREINSAHLRVGEDEELLKEREILSNAERLYESASRAYKLAYESEEGPAAADMLGKAVEALEGTSKIDDRLRTPLEALSQALSLVEEGARCLGDYVESIEFDPKRLEEVESRLDLIECLKKKYGDTIGSILEYRRRIEREIEELSTAEERLEKIEGRIKKVEAELAEAVKGLSGERHKLAKELSRMMRGELSDLAMPHARFEVTLRVEPSKEGIEWGGSKVAIGPRGVDKVEFLFSANPGEPVGPLSKIASGGEMSRVMLALKSIHAWEMQVPTLIFDEIDIGIGGRTTLAVAEKLRKVAHRTQVLCVTHLPQIASLADCHFVVEKKEKGRARILAERLSEEERAREIARMLGGEDLTPVTLRHAEELLAWARSLRSSRAKERGR